MSPPSEAPTLRTKGTRKSWWFAALAYGLPMGLLFSFQFGDWRVGMAGGLIAGVIFSFLMRMFTSHQAKRFKVERPDFGDEPVAFEGLANHFRGAEGVGGYLWLTSKRLHFSSHNMNFQNHEWSAPLSAVARVDATRTAGIIPNGLQITLTSGEVHRFVVHQNKTWAEAIQTALKTSAAG